MDITFNLAGSQFNEYSKPELEYVGVTCRLVHEPDNKFDDKALAIMTEDGDEAIGYVPKNGRKFAGHQALFEALIFDMDISIVVQEAVFKNNDRFNRTGKGEFTHFAITLTIDAGDASPSYTHPDTGVEYMRMSRVLEGVKWNPDDHGLEEWMVQCFKNYKEYETYLSSCAIDGQIIHHKAEIALWGQALPEGVDPLPDNILKVIKKTSEVVATEERVYDDDINTAGTYDGLAEYDGKLTILDWKRSKQCQDKYLRQVAFYAHATGAEQAVIALARGEDNVILDQEELDKYYAEFVALAKFKKAIQ